MENKKPLSEFSEAELAAALAEKKQQKNQERDAYKELVATTVPLVMDDVLSASRMLQDTKVKIFNYFKDAIKIKNDAFGVKDKQRSHTFTDDRNSITIGYRQTDGWDDTAHAGIEKIRNFIRSLSTSKETAVLVETIEALLKKDAKNNLKANRVLELQKMVTKFNNSEFTDGVEIIMNSYKPVRSCWYVEALQIDNTGKWQPVPLSISAVDFPEGFDFDFNEKPQGDATGA